MAVKKEVFSARARAVLALTEIELKYQRQRVIREPHILLGLFDEKDGIAGQVLRQIGFSRAYLVDLIKSYGTNTPDGVYKIEFASGAKRVLELSVDEARRLNQDCIGTRHLLLAIVRKTNNPVLDIFEHMNIAQHEIIDRIRQTTMQSIDTLDCPETPQTIPNKTTNKSGLWYQITKRMLSAIGVNDSQEPESGPNRVEQKAVQPDYDTQRIASATEVLHLEPDNAGLYSFRAGLYYQRKDYEAAIADATSSIRLQPNNTQPYYQRGMAYMNKKDYGAAFIDFTEMIRIDPKDYSGYISRGLSLRSKGDYEQAILDYTEAIRLDPQKSAAYSLRAGAYLSINEHNLAIADCNQALRLDPDSTAAYQTRGTARADLKEFQGAEDDFKIMHRLCPDYSWSHSNLGWLHLLRGEYDQAISACNEAIRLEPKNGTAYYSRGSALAANSEEQGAVADYRLALEHWENIHSKHSEHYAQEMQSYIDKWAKPHDNVEA